METAAVVVPTPPRLPMNARTWPRPSAAAAATLLFEQSGQLLAAGRLDQIVGGAGREHVAVEPDIVDRAERHNLEVGAADRTRCAEFGDRRRRLAEVDDQHARTHPIVNTPQRRIERRLETQLVVQLQFADDALDAIERRLIVHDGKHACPVGLARGADWTFGCGCGHYHGLPVEGAAVLALADDENAAAVPACGKGVTLSLR